MKRTFLLLLALAGGTLAEQALADVLHTESRQDVTFGVIDLTPADGQAASFSFNDIHTDYRRIFTSPGQPNRVRLDSVDGPAPAEFGAAYYGASSSASSTGSPGNFTLIADSTDLQPLGGSATARIDQTFTVSLSAHSVLTLAAENYTASTVLGGSASTFQEDYYSSIRMEGPHARQGHVYQDAGPLDPAETFNRWLAIANTSDSVMEVKVTLSAWNRLSVVQAPAPLAAVPEPSTWGMLLAGLCVTGMAARRRALGVRQR